MLARDANRLLLAGPGIQLTNWSGVDLSDVEASEIIAPHVALDGAVMRRASLRGAYMPHANLHMANLEDADLSFTQLHRSDLSNTVLRGARLYYSGLSACCFRNCDARSANFYAAYLNGADLEGADLRGVDMQGADLSFAVLRGADMRHAVLGGADLDASDLKGAVLKGADLRGANLGKAVLSDCELSDARTYGARYDSQTVWPEGFSPDGSLTFTPDPNPVPKPRRSGGRKITRRRSENLRLWTVQPPAVWKELCEKGIVYTNQRHVPAYNRLPYDWLRGQMVQQMHGTAGDYPWWAHLEWPSIRHTRYREGTSVVIELSIPVERVLIYDSGAWLTVLCNRYVALTVAEEIAWDEELKAAGLKGWPLPQPWRSRVISSWLRCLDPEALKAGDRCDSAHLQAAFLELRLADVVRIDFVDQY